MSSRLFQRVREEAGLAYSVYSAPDFFRDAGMLSIHMGVSPERGREALALTRGELVELATQGPGREEVEDAKSQIRGSVLDVIADRLLGARAGDIMAVVSIVSLAASMSATPRASFSRS